MEERIVGKVKWFSPSLGYGFIIGPTQEDVFVHYTHVEMEGYKVLVKDQNVSYVYTTTEDGPQAHSVEII